MSAELMKLKFVRRPSVSQISQNLLRRFFSNFSCGFFPWGWTSVEMDSSEKKSHFLILSSAWPCQQSSWNQKSSVVRPLTQFLRNCYMDPGQILWKATYPPYLQTAVLFFQNFWFSNFYEFLALLDSVSRGHGMGLLSVVHPSGAQFSLNLMHGFLSKFGCCFLWAIRLDIFFNFWKKKSFWIFYEYFLFWLTCDPMGGKILKCYSYKSQPKAFKLFVNFLLNGPHKTTLGTFEILNIEILTNFIHFH